MPGKDNDYTTRSDKPEADKASKQNAHVDRNEDMSDVEPEGRRAADKALRKNVGSNKKGDIEKTSSDSEGSKRK
jgi:hypothetical protein